jgi:hypothetical protein
MEHEGEDIDFLMEAVMMAADPDGPDGGDDGSGAVEHSVDKAMKASEAALARAERTADASVAMRLTQSALRTRRKYCHPLSMLRYHAVGHLPFEPRAVVPRRRRDVPLLSPVLESRVAGVGVLRSRPQAAADERRARVLSARARLCDDGARARAMAPIHCHREVPGTALAAASTHDPTHHPSPPSRRVPAPTLRAARAHYTLHPSHQRFAKPTRGRRIGVVYGTQLAELEAALGEKRRAHELLGESLRSLLVTHGAGHPLTERVASRRGQVRREVKA